jgi:hypothetical protein
MGEFATALSGPLLFLISISISRIKDSPKIGTPSSFGNHRAEFTVIFAAG